MAGEGGDGVSAARLGRAPQGRRISVRSLDSANFGRAKAGFATRRVPREAMRTPVGGMVRPPAGDVVLAGVTKVTGTGSGGDYWVMLDAGAHVMLDFTDVGFASTYRQPMVAVERGFLELTDHLTAAGSAVRLIEVADGIYQCETSRLIESEVFRSTVDVVLFAAADAMGAVAGVEHLRSRGLPVAAVSGRITRSPL